MLSAIRLVASWVAEAMAGAVVSGDPAREFAGVSIDSRTLKPAELYVAIRGERLDGADFALAALAAGAAGIVVPRERGRSMPDARRAAIIEVDDTLVALQTLAHRIRRESTTRVVAITGSAGKTTTKEVTAEFLAARYRVFRNPGNLNNHIGLPLSLIELRKQPEIAVVELGMNHIGEVSTLVRIAEPDVRVWTNVGEAHLGFFGSLDEIADAKAEILEGAAASTVLVANADDNRIASRSSSFAGRVVTFGIDRPALVRASEVIDRGIEGTTATVITPRGTVEISTPLVGRGNLANVLAATAVAIEFDVPLDAIAVRARDLRPAAHRGQVVRLSGGVTVIDDSYNANPTATRKALDVLASGRIASAPLRADRVGGRRIAVLGEMLELGSHSESLHEDVGRYAAAGRVDLLLAVGGDSARALARAAIAAGMPLQSVTHCSTSDDAADAVSTMVRAGDVVLVKGSRGVRTDRVVDRLKAERS